MRSANASHYLAILVQKLPLEEKERLRSDYSKGADSNVINDDGLEEWLAIPLRNGVTYIQFILAPNP